MIAKTLPRCCAIVYTSLHFRGRSCSRLGRVERDGKHYCKQHDPVAVSEALVKSGLEYEKRFGEEMRIRRLNRAAPLLLEALETLVNQADYRGLVGVWWDEARAAIAKARGSSHE